MSNDNLTMEQVDRLSWRTRSYMYEPWMDDVQVGDVLRDAAGNLRVVRHLSRYNNSRRRGQLKCVSFTIKKCSWTTRCDTVLTYTDLRLRGFRPTGVRRKLRTRLDKLIAEDCGPRATRNLSCCQVEGIP